MNLLNNIKIDKTKLKEFLIVLTTLFLVTCFLYMKFINGKYIFGSGDYLAPKLISESVKNLEYLYGEYPYWMPSIFGGMPTIHSLQNISNYYMPNLILNILKIFSVPEIWTQLIHLIFAGLGVYALLRFLKLDFMVSFFGSIMFLLTPYMNVCIVHGHGSQIMTAAYIPWICLGLLNLWNKQNLQNLALLSILIGFQLQRGHIQIAYYTWLMIAIFVIYKIISSKFVKDFYIYLIFSLLFGFLMALSIIWPSYLYSEHSIRAVTDQGSAFTYATNWSFSFKEMVTFIIPSFYGFGGSTYWGTIEPAMTDFPNYLGVFTIIFIIYALKKKNNDSYFNYFLILSLFFILLSLGKNFFLYEYIFSYLPFFNKFRVPMMALMIFQFSIIIVSSYGMQRFYNEFNKNKKATLKYFSIINLFLLILFFTIKFLFINLLTIDDLLKNMIHHDLNILIIIITILLFIKIYSLYNTINIYPILIIIIILSTLNMYIINSKILDRDDLIIQSKDIEKLLSPLNELKQKYNNNKEKFRFISFTEYKGMKNWSGYSNLENVNGYHPAKLKNYGTFEPYIQALLYGKNTNLAINVLKLLNVEKVINWNDEWVISSAKDNLNSLDRIFFINELKNYTTQEELLVQLNDRYFNAEQISYTKAVIPDFKIPTSKSYLSIKNWSPNKIVIETNLEDDNFVGLSEIYYPNWEITSHDIDIIQINGLLRGFVAPKGSNTIIMEFNYNDIKYSSLISFLTFFLMLFIILLTNLLTYKKNKFNQ